MPAAPGTRVPGTKNNLPTFTLQCGMCGIHWVIERVHTRHMHRQDIMADLRRRWTGAIHMWWSRQAIWLSTPVTLQAAHVLTADGQQPRPAGRRQQSKGIIW